MLPDLEIAVRLLVAAILGSLIGFERERLLWAAGIRTHMLVCVGACLVMIVSAYGFNDVLSDHAVLDPSRVAARFRHWFSRCRVHLATWFGYSGTHDCGEYLDCRRGWASD